MSPPSYSFPRGAGSAADALLEKLDDPRIAEALASLLDKSENLNSFVEVLEGFLQRNEGLLEVVSQRVGRLGRAGTAALGKSFEKLDLDDLKAASGQIQGTLPLLRDVLNQFAVLRQAGFFDADVVAILGRTGRAIAAATRDPKARSSETRGVFSLLGLLKDPEIARSLNFIISFARHFGSDQNHDGSPRLKNASTAAPPRPSANKP